MSIATGEEVTAGRPRDPRIERAVLAATAELLVRHGYADLNLAEVARRARTTKPAIYRRWRSKAHLVHEAAFPLEAAQATTADGTADGSVASELRVMVATVARMFSTPVARAALPGLVAEFQADPLLHASLLERFRVGPIADLAVRLREAAARGEIRPDLDADALIAAVAGPVLFTLLADPAADLDRAWVDRTTSLLLRGVVR